MPRDLSYSTLNYEQQGGGVWVVGGQLNVVAGGSINFENGASMTHAGTEGTAPAAPAATAATNTTPYGYAQAQADAIVTWIRGVDTILRNVGIMS